MLIVLITGLVLVAAAQYALSSSSAAVGFYAAYVYTPFQVFRRFLLGWLSISIGDLIYIAASVWIISLIVKGIYTLVKRQVSKVSILKSLFNIAVFAGVAYIWFFIGWGGNYHKQPLAEYWKLNEAGPMSDSDLINFDKALISKLNEYAPLAKFSNFEEAEKSSRDYYTQFAATSDKANRLGIKPSIFGNALEYSGVQGYFNPFTGEGQMNSKLPDFLQPFVLCHEMAHQAGIAAEDDANLLSFVVGINSEDPAFVYSACFNVWLYTNSRLRMRDSSLAAELKKELNPVTIAHIGILRELRKKYRSPLSTYSSYFYDNFLKLNNQEKGMESYDDVVYSAWAWMRGAGSVAGIP